MQTWVMVLTSLPSGGEITLVNGDCGKGIEINADDGFKYKYCHLSKRAVHPPVKTGDKIGEVGNTGCGKCGTHLHIEMRRKSDNQLVDPEVFLFPGLPQCPFDGPLTGRLRAAIAAALRVVIARDPNDKVGSQGIGSARYLSGEEPLRYALLFENVETATAPAQEVIISDQLDIGTLDLTTFSLGPIGFGDTLVVPPPGLSQYTTDVDLRPGKNLIVRITAIDVQVCFWKSKRLFGGPICSLRSSVRRGTAPRLHAWQNTPALFPPIPSTRQIP